MSGKRPAGGRGPVRAELVEAGTRRDNDQMETISERQTKRVADYAAGRADAQAVLKDLEMLQLELLKN